MSRYLTPYFLEQSLKRGKSVAQFLGLSNHEGEKIVRFLLIDQDEQGFLLSLYESYDEGSEEFCDVAAFTTRHDEPVEQHFSTLDAALEFAASEYQADSERWISESVLGDEYRDNV